jgi:hypothetical protein
MRQSTLIALVAMIHLCLIAPAMNGQTIFWNQTTVASGLPQPIGLALDGAGNVYVTDISWDQVLRESPTGSGYAQAVVADYPSDTVTENNPNANPDCGGGIDPYGVTVDGSGNVYSTYAQSNYMCGYPGGIVTETPLSSGGYSQAEFESASWSIPYGVAVQGLNVFAAIYLSNPDPSSPAAPAFCGHTPNIIASCIVEIYYEYRAGGGGQYHTTTIYEGFSQAPYLQFIPHGVAVDPSGNIYFDNSVNGQIWKGTPNSSGGYTLSVIATIAGNTNLWGIAADGVGDVYVVDQLNSVVYREAPSSGGYVQSALFTNASNGLVNPTGIAVNSAGNNIYIADTGNGRVLLESPLRLRF